MCVKASTVDAMLKLVPTGLVVTGSCCPTDNLTWPALINRWLVYGRVCALIQVHNAGVW